MLKIGHWGLRYVDTNVALHKVRADLARCIHCLQQAGTTKDHVFPRSWYPDNTPSTVQRPTAPSCRACNQKFGRLEEYVLQRLGWCVDPRAGESLGISSKALRAAGIGVAEDLSDKERAVREKLRQTIRREAKEYREVEGKPGQLPGFGPQGDAMGESRIALLIDADTLKQVCRKVLRGLEYWQAKRYVEPPYRDEVFFIRPEAEEQIPAILGTLTSHLGPGFDVRRTQAQEASGHVLYRIGIWGRLIVHGAVFTDDFEPGLPVRAEL